MFDYLRCKYPLPPIDGLNPNELTYQSKDTPAQWCDLYEIREDGTLWHQAYDTEDRSEQGKWKAEHPGEEVPESLKNFESIIGCMTSVNHRWEQVTGLKMETITFYDFHLDDLGWIEWKALFADDKVDRILLIENRKPKEESTE
jgi:hypothetical protein